MWILFIYKNSLNQMFYRYIYFLHILYCGEVIMDKASKNVSTLVQCFLNIASLLLIDIKWWNGGKYVREIAFGNQWSQDVISWDLKDLWFRFSSLWGYLHFIILLSCVWHGHSKFFEFNTCLYLLLEFIRCSL